jgi:DnaB helicase-like protein
MAAMNAGITQLRAADSIPTPPENLGIEQKLLGAVLISNAEYRRCAGVVHAEDFALGVHQRIFDAIGRLVEAGQPADPVVLAPYFETDGGAQYLVKLVRCAVTVRNAQWYAYWIADLAMRRRLGSDLFNLEPGIDSIDLLFRHRDRLDALRRAKIRLGVGDDAR